MCSIYRKPIRPVLVLTGAGPGRCVFYRGAGGVCGHYGRVRVRQDHITEYFSSTGPLHSGRGTARRQVPLCHPGETAGGVRRSHLGFVFQDFNLLDTFSLRDNILLPLVLAGERSAAMERKLMPLAQRLGISELLSKYPYEVSGGQKQRAAVARALITAPELILADEPTGALDSRASARLLELFEAINREGQTIVMVTHSVEAASHAGRVLFLRDGRVYHQLFREGESREHQVRAHL